MPLPASAQIFPYHLSEYVCRVQRASPFKYYTDVLYLALREERSYDTIPNFTVRGLRKGVAGAEGQRGGSERGTEIVPALLLYVHSHTPTRTLAPFCPLVLPHHTLLPLRPGGRRAVRDGRGPQRVHRDHERVQGQKADVARQQGARQGSAAAGAPRSVARPLLFRWPFVPSLLRRPCPQEEKEARIEPWWLVEVTNVGELGGGRGGFLGLVRGRPGWANSPLHVR